MSPKLRTLVLSPAEHMHLVNTMEGCLEELEMLMIEVSWYTTELPDRLITALEILKSSEK